MKSLAAGLLLSLLPLTASQDIPIFQQAAVSSQAVPDAAAPSGVVASELSSTNNNSLRLVLEVCRHGARSPLYVMPNDHNTWDEELGQLTSAGMRQHYLIGRELRRRYIEEMKGSFLRPEFSSDQVWVRSTDYDRTLQSAISQLSGLFPVGTGPVLDSRSQPLKTVPPINIFDLEGALQQLNGAALPVRTQPIPIHTINDHSEYLLKGWDGWSVCPRHNQLFEAAMVRPEFAKMDEENRAFLEKITKLAGFKEPIRLRNVTMVIDPILSAQFHDRPIPHGFTDEIVAHLNTLYDFCVESLFATEEAKRLVSSEFFKDVVAKMDAQIHGEVRGQRPSLRFGFYSSHDWTVASFLAGLDVFDGHNPDFASVLFFELHKISAPSDSKDPETAYAVKTIYNDKTLRLPPCMDSDLCPYNLFKQHLQRRFVEDIVKACARQDSAASGEHEHEHGVGSAHLRGGEFVRLNLV